VKGVGSPEQNLLNSYDLSKIAFECLIFGTLAGKRPMANRAELLCSPMGVPEHTPAISVTAGFQGAPDDGIEAGAMQRRIGVLLG
jgi:hypothetical protein